MLRDRNFRLYWSTNALFFLGSQMQVATRQWLVLELTSSRSILGLTGFLQGIMVLCLSPAGGVMADRLSKRNILIVGRGALFVISVVMTILVLSDYVQIPHLLAAALVAGAVLAFVQPATQSYVYDLVGRDRLGNAVALNATATSLATLVGPSIGGVMIVTAGIGSAYLLSSGGYLAGVAVLALIPILGKPTMSHRSSFFQDMIEVFRIVKTNPTMRWILFCAFFALFAGSVLAMRPVYAKDILEVGGVGYGLMFTAFGAGAIVSSAVIASVGLRRRAALMIPIALVIWCIGMVTYAFSRNFALTLGCEALMGAAAQLWMASAMTATQIAVPEELRSRAVSLVFMVLQLAFVGWLLGGFLADAFGATFAVAFSGAIPIPFLLYAILFGKPLRSV